MTQHGVQGGNISLLPFRLKENNYISLKFCCNCITILLILGTDCDSTIICNSGLVDYFYYIPVAARSKAHVFGRSPAEIVGSNPTGDVDICLL